MVLSYYNPGQHKSLATSLLVWNQFCYKGFVREKSHTVRIFLNAFYLLWSDRAIGSSFAYATMALYSSLSEVIFIFVKQG